MTIHESSCRKFGSGYGPAAWALAPVANGPATAAALKLTTSMPEPLRNVLREIVPVYCSRSSSTRIGMSSSWRSAEAFALRGSEAFALRASSLFFVKVVMLYLPGRGRPGRRHRRRSPLDGGVNAVIRHAAAQRPGHPLADLRIGRIRIPVQQHLGRHDLPVLAETALRHLLVNPGPLYGVQLPSLGQSFERGDLALDGGTRRNARPNGSAVHDHGACPALTKSAAKPRALQFEIVAQDIEQRSRRVDIHGMRPPVYLQGDVAHSPLSLRIGSLEPSRCAPPYCRRTRPPVHEHGTIFWIRRCHARARQTKTAIVV